MARITGPETGHGSGISGPGMGTSHRVRECSRVGRTHTGFVFLLFTREAREGTTLRQALLHILCPTFSPTFSSSTRSIMSNAIDRKDRRRHAPCDMRVTTWSPRRLGFSSLPKASPSRSLSRISTSSSVYKSLTSVPNNQFSLSPLFSSVRVTQ
jgi:hypothetical protein